MATLPVMNIGHMVVRTDSLGLSSARKHVHSIAKGLNFTDDEASDILIAVGEALSNAYRHGTEDHRTGFIYLDWEYAKKTFTVSVVDEGSTSARHQLFFLGSSYTPTGRGLDIIRRSMDNVLLESGNGTRITLTKRSKRDPKMLQCSSILAVI